MKKLLLFLLLIPSILFAETPQQVDFLIGGLTNSSGDPLASGKVYTYSCGTTTDKTTWQDSAKATPHANPVVLDSQGKKLVFADGCYKFRIDNSADSTQYTLDNLRFGDSRGSEASAGLAGGSANAQTVTLTPALLALTDGVVVRWVSVGTNTSTVTLNVNGLGATALRRSDGSALQAGDLQILQSYTAFYSSYYSAWLLSTPPISAGVYTPTLTAVANVAASTAFACQYLRILNVVNVSCYLGVDPTAAAPTVTQLGVSLPIASNLAALEQLSGTCATNSTTTNQSAGIIADITNDRAQIDWQTATTANHALHCIFTYKVV